MYRTVAIASLLILNTAMSYAADDAVAAFKLKGSIDIQAQKRLHDLDAEPRNNLDQLYGRFNFGGAYASDDFNAGINIRAYPAGFGYEVLTGAAFDTTGQGDVLESRQSLPKFQVEKAWVEYKSNPLSLRLGRWWTSTTRTFHFGNYLAQNPGGNFMARVAYHNAAEFSFTTGPLSSSIMLCAGDRNLNTGYLRVYEQITVAESFHAGIGYRSNVFDAIHDDQAEIENRFALLADYAVMPKLMPYFEAGILQDLSGDDAQWQVPVLVGTSLPAGPVADMLAAEVEYVNDRQVQGEDKPVEFNLYMVKNLGAHAKIRAALFSDPAGTSPLDLKVGFRFSGSI